MIISQKLRKTNIAEYLLYMWQVEDLLRAYDCSLSRLRSEYLCHFDIDGEQLDEMTDWYADLIRMMNGEGCRQSGHLQINRLVLQQLNELNAQLLASSKFPFYSTEYYKVLPFIVELRRRGQQDEGELETCFNALYGMMMLRLQKKEVSPDTQHAISEITTFIGMLNDYWFKDKAGELKFED